MDKNKNSVKRIWVCPEFHKYLKKKSIDEGMPTIIEYTRVLTQRINLEEEKKQSQEKSVTKEKKKGFYDYKIF